MARIWKWIYHAILSSKRNKYIRKQANRELARQRLGVHVYMKSMADSIMTTFQDIHEKPLAFKGASFAEIVLQQKNDKGQ